MKVGVLATALLVEAALLSALAACGGSPPKPQLPSPLNEGIVAVGVKPYPSFFEDVNGTHIGFEVSARKKILSHAGAQKSIPTQIWTNNWASLLEKEQVHLVMGMISDSDDRATHFRLARSYLRTDIGLLTLANAEELNDVSELAGKTVCTVEETSAHATIDNLQQKGYSIHSVTAPSPTACIQKVKNGEAYAYSTDRLILMGFSTHNDSIDEGTQKSYYRVLNLSLGREQHISIVLNKKDSQACQRLVDAIGKYVESNDWLADLRHEVIDEYLERAPGDPDMTDQQVRDRFGPTVRDAERCTDPPPPNAVN
ncbi:transporter substrate-binding domain-containing protein [Nonomuraea sp. K274]|uniref:Transporter substrate-binding domain-containing protein n=1 Tax=Nonomuraea cypriaca TaxID=1187855 RepID=A0A931A386_9ACTN|nr:transporter substrate-binding domain-containing protein [Nonomuraea cypriaca]MBF8184258.1 transporter substrate-binding domain-containing protein [Nonomuraea cypriaca]